MLIEFNFCYDVYNAFNYVDCLCVLNVYQETSKSKHGLNKLF